MTHTRKTHSGPESSLLDTLYEAAARPELWHSFLQQAREELHADKAFILNHSITASRGSIWAQLGCSDELCRVMELGNGGHPWVQIIRKHASQGWYCSTMEDDLPDSFRSTQFYEDWYRRFEIEWMASAIVFAPGGAMPGMAVTRNEKQEPFSADDKKLLQQLAPHLRRAFHTHLSLQAVREWYAAGQHALELSGAACIILDARGLVLHINRRAQNLLDCCDALRIRERRLLSCLAQEQSPLDNCIQTACGGILTHSSFAEPGGLTLHNWTGATLYLSAIPHRATLAAGQDRPSALIFLTAPEEQGQGEHRVWQSIFGFSPAECRVAEMMLHGMEVPQIAEASRIKADTVRYYQKSIYRKAGVRGQGPLMRLLSRLPSSAIF